MYIGYVVGIVIASCIVIGGCAWLIYTKISKKKSTWAIWTIVFGIASLISAAVNFNIFN